jgi:hypothetical protein
MRVYAEGSNFTITLQGGVVTCRVWIRADLDSAEGARSAEVISRALRELAMGPRDRAKGLVLDQSGAPPVAGPRTQAALCDLLAAWERAGRRVGLALGDSPVRNLQMRRLLVERAPTFGRAFASAEQARTWVLTPSGLTEPPRRGDSGGKPGR